MKFFSFLLVASSALLLLVPSAVADAENVGNVADIAAAVVKDDKVIENKLLHEVDVKDESIAADDDDDETAAESDSGKQDVAVPADSLLITDKDLEQITDPGMKRLARHLKSFHNNNLQRSLNSNVEDEDDNDDDNIPKERAARRRQRVRRRNGNNKIRRVNRNRQGVKRRRVVRRRVNKKNGGVRRGNKKNGNKRRRKNGVRRIVRVNGNRKNRRGTTNKRRRNKRRNGNKTKRTRRNKGNVAARKSENEKLEHNSDENADDVKPQASEKETVEVAQES